jgi:hypothetical protein
MIRGPDRNVPDLFFLLATENTEGTENFFATDCTDYTY